MQRARLYIGGGAPREWCHLASEVVGVRSSGLPEGTLVVSAAAAVWAFYSAMLTAWQAMALEKTVRVENQALTRLYLQPSLANQNRFNASLHMLQPHTAMVIMSFHHSLLALGVAMLAAILAVAFGRRRDHAWKLQITMVIGIALGAVMLDMVSYWASTMALLAK